MKNLKETYIVYLTTYSGDTELPPYYIGSTNMHEIQKGYTGSVSSEKWEALYLSEKKNNSGSFSVELISEEFDVRQDALDRELEEQIKVDAKNNPLYFNMAHAKGCFGNMGPEAEVKRQKSRSKWSDEYANSVNESIRETLTGYTHTEEACENMKIAQANRSDEDEQSRRDKISEKLTGHIRAQKECDNISKRMLGNTNGKTAEDHHMTKRIQIFDADNILQHDIEISFNKYCKENGIPKAISAQLQLTYLNNTTYNPTNPTSITKAKQKGFDKYFGWKARIVK